MPLLLTAAGGETLLASPLEDFFTASQVASKATGNFSFGLHGELRQAPAGHVHATLFVGGSSVRAAMMSWGAHLLKAGGSRKRRDMRWTVEGDASLRQLSYYTDNGAYYYYQTVNRSGSCSSAPPCGKLNPPTPQDGTGYRTTIQELQAYFASINLPIGAVQYDSWWYYKGTKEGIKLWEPMPSTVGGPDINGSPSTWLKLKHLPVVLHSRWYQDDNDYTLGTAPGLPAGSNNWSWFVDAAGGTAVSNDSRFFEHIFTRAQEGLGMATYEQDFLAKQYERNAHLRQRVGAGREWLSAMAVAAERRNVTVQYCMALPRHVLQSASFARVTQARASHDYGQSRSDDTEQWSAIGLTSLLFWSIGLLPFKDTFWSSMFESGNHWGADEADPELQTLVSALTAGPIGPGDGIGLVDRARLMQTCRIDGVLLKPLHPAFSLGSAFAAALDAASSGVQMNTIGMPNAWATLMAPNNSAPTHGRSPTKAMPPPLSHLLFFANTSLAGFRVTVDELHEIEAEAEAAGREVDTDSEGWEADTEAATREPFLVQSSLPARYWAREFYSGEHRVVEKSAPLQVSHKPKPISCANGGYLPTEYCMPFELWSLSPLGSSRWVLLGEMDKYVPISHQRFTDLLADAASISVVVLGAPREVVSLGVVDVSLAVAPEALPSELAGLYTVACEIGGNGRAVLSCSSDRRGSQSACSCSLVER